MIHTHFFVYICKKTDATIMITSYCKEYEMDDRLFEYGIYHWGKKNHFGIKFDESTLFINITA